MKPLEKEKLNGLLFFQAIVLIASLATTIIAIVKGDMLLILPNVTVFVECLMVWSLVWHYEGKRILKDITEYYNKKED